MIWQRIGSWWGARSLHVGPVRVSTMRVPGGGLGSYKHRLVIEAGRFHAMLTWGPS